MMGTPLDEKAEHPRIWLEPAGAPDRCWCSENQWGDEGVEYILASEAPSAVALPDELEVVTHAIILPADHIVFGPEPFETPKGQKSEPLVTLSQAHSTIAALRAERDEAQGKLALIVDRIVYSDSYGVPGSDFQCCHLCNGGGAPGVPFEHDERCPVRQVVRDYEQWFDDIHATEDALRETEARAETAEAEVKRLTEALNEIRELNMSGADENGHRWANSDLIEQTVVSALSGSKE